MKYRTLIKSLLLMTLLISAIGLTSFADQIIYVDDDAAAANDGSSWENAYIYLQDALTDANDLDKPVEIRVAQGTYTPDQGAGQIPGDREATFRLINGVTLAGGYAGIGADDPNVRDFELYETILSGDLNGDDIIVGNPRDLYSEPTRIDNSSHVVESRNTNETAVLDGCIITGGFYKGGGRHFTAGAAGMINYSGNPTLTSCTFTGHSAVMAGSAFCNIDEGNPTLTGCKFNYNYNLIGGTIYNSGRNLTLNKCVFTGNHAYMGGGMFNLSNLELTNCRFVENSASMEGGGIYNSGNLEMVNCQFISNSAYQGGGEYNDSGISRLINCQFIGNYSQESGGGMAGSDTVNSILKNCIFKDNFSNINGGGIAGCNLIFNCVMSGNKAVNNGGAIYGWGETTNCTIIGNKAEENGGGIYAYQILTLTNNIIRDNKALTGDEIYAGLRYQPTRGTPPIISTSVATVRYNNIQGSEDKIPVDTNCTLAWESGNIDEEPLFANPGYWANVNDLNIIVEPNDPNAVWVDGDYHLKSQAGRYDPYSGSWVIDDVTSPCIDAGDPNSTIGDEPFPNGGIINMGAYGGTAEASKSYFGEPLCETVIAGDINGDCKVDITDLEILVSHWLEQ